MASDVSRVTISSPLVTRHSSLAMRWLPALDVGLAVLAAAIWYVRPQEGVWPLGLIAVAWLLRLAAYGYLTRATPFDAPLVLFLLTAYVGATVGYNQGSEWAQGVTPLMWAWAKFWYIVAAIALFYAIANLRSVDQVWWLIRLYALLGAFVALYFVITNDWSAGKSKFDVLTQIGSWVSDPLPAVPGHRLQPNVAGGLTAMILPFVVSLLREARSKGRKPELALWGAVALAILLGLILSASRGAWLALAGVGLFWVGAHALSVLLAPACSRRGLARRDEAAARVTRRNIILLLISAVIALTVLAIVLLSLPQWQVLSVTVAGESKAGIPGGETVISRLELLQGAWALAQDYLFTGGGLGAFPMLFSTYYLLIPVFFIVHSHNLFLDILVEQGLFGLIAYLWLLAAVMSRSVALRGLAESVKCQMPSLNSQFAIRNSQFAIRNSQLVLEATLASLVVMVVHGLVDDVPYGSRALMLLFVPMGLVASLSSQQLTVNNRQLTVNGQQSTVGSPKPALSQVEGSKAAISLTLRSDVIASVFCEAISPPQEGDCFAKMRLAMTRVRNVSISSSVLRHLSFVALIVMALLVLGLVWERGAVLGAGYANLGALAQARAELSDYHWPDRLPEQVRKDGDLSSAMTYFEQALQYDPAEPTANRRLGAIALARGENDRALSYLVAALRAETQSPATWRLLANAYAALGRKTEACQIVEQARVSGWGGAWTFGRPLCQEDGGHR